MDFLQKLDAAVAKNNSLLCVGLDPDVARLPKAFRDVDSPLFGFSKAIIDATADLACAFKPNPAFYESRGAAGIEELKRTCDYIHEKYPDVPVIVDLKRADIGNTNQHSAVFAFNYLGADAVTVHPWLGGEALQPFLDYQDKGIIVLCRTSNDGAGEFQDLAVDGRPLYLHVAEHVAQKWNANGNCLLVVGATYPEEIAKVRELVGDDMVFLVPGLGAQGGDAEAVIRAGTNAQGRGLIINSARAILYASSGDDFAEAARAEAARTRDAINQYRSS
ncbi:MAG TPA: orotidine-5'-phosphate decarboxylase [Candidatus Saccharimonadales bacterium]|nr:orotidine-5'-phosphate decarboxylase [Candidatus Saccharimonadales bacterium]